MPINQISAALSSIKIASEMAKGILSLNKDVAVNEKAAKLLSVIISLQHNIMSLQSEYGELLKSKDNLENKLKEYETWKVTESQYKLEEISHGVFVRVPNNSHPYPEPKHWLCTNCWQDKKKSILQLRWKMKNGIDAYECPRCKSVINDRSHPKPPTPRVLPRIGPKIW
jgi:hypothetical protein